MRSVSIVSPERNNRNNRNNRNMSATLAQHGKKKEFLNTFVILTSQRNNRNMFVRVCPFNYLALFKEKKIIVRRHANWGAYKVRKQGSKRDEIETFSTKLSNEGLEYGIQCNSIGEINRIGSWK